MLISPAPPVSTPMRLIRPPIRTACSDLERVPAPPTSTTWSTPRPWVSSRIPLFPGGGLFIVDPRGRPHIEHALQFLVAARGRDDRGTGELGELAAKSETPPVPWIRTVSPALRRPAANKAFHAVTVAQAKSRPSSKLRCSGRRTTPASFRSTYSDRTPSIEPPSSGFTGRFGQIPGQPGLHEDRRPRPPTLTRVTPALDLGDLARSVRQRHRGQGKVLVVKPFENEQVAIIQGRGPHPDEHFAQARGGDGKLVELQAFDAAERLDSVCFHGSRSPRPSPVFWTSGEGGALPGHAIGKSQVERRQLEVFLNRDLAELLPSPRLDLPDPLLGHAELLPQLFQGVGDRPFQAEPAGQYPPFPVGQAAEESLTASRVRFWATSYSCSSVR